MSKEEPIKLTPEEINTLREENERLRRELAAVRSFTGTALPHDDVVDLPEDARIQTLRHVQEDLQEANRLLECRVRERTAELLSANEILKNEIAQRNKVEEALRLDEARFEALFNLSQMTEATVPEIISFVLEAQIKITKSKAGTLALLDGEEKVTSTFNWSGGVMRICSLSEERMYLPLPQAGLCMQAVRERKPVIINDYSQDHPFKKGFPDSHFAISRLVGVPVLNGDKIVALAVVSNKEEDYDTQDVRQVSLLLDGMWRLFERKRAEKNLQEKAELLDLASDCIMVRDLEGRILFWNGGAESLYGWTKKEAICQFVHTLLKSRFNKPLEQIKAELFRDGRWEGELIHVNRQGDQIITASRWVLLRDGDGAGRAILEINNDISARKLMEEELEIKSNRLQEVNAALKALLRQRDEDRREFEEAFLTNIENLIMPYIRRIKGGPLSNTQSSLVEILEAHLGELTSQFGRTLALQYRVLTPTEMRVAALVRDGKTSKEIADLLCISEKTASFHRNNIRNKLGLRGEAANLRSHLLSLT